MEQAPGPSMASYWMDSAAQPDRPPLTGDVRADVAVLGGGIAGLSIAWELTRAGRSVVVLEAGRIASGVTGHTTAKLSALHTLVYSSLNAEDGRLYARSQTEAVEHVARTCAELDLDCELERAAAYTYTDTTEGLRRIRDEAEAARQAGLPAEYVTETALPYPVVGAVRVRAQAQFHPRKYLLGLAAAMEARGARIYERTRAVRLADGKVSTADGRVVTATDVVVATHYPIFDRALLFARMVPRRELVVAVPIAEDDDPHGMYITPEHGIRSVRTAPRDGGRLLLVTGEQYQPGEGGVGARLDRLAAWARERFGAAPVYRWAAQDNHTTDGLPFVGPLHAGARHAYVATGFGGWGMSNGVMAGLLLAALIAGEERPWAGLYDPRRIHPLREAGALLKAQASVAAHFVGDRFGAGGEEDLARLLPGQAAVVKVGGERCAAYRDADGRVHAVSAVCTHLGCVVGFNDAERTWECPCHGSRFALDGTILQGPATEPLKRIEL
ncbi:FAD-dependent oxidoreductase [Nonomuraea sp. NPDC003804]|uniref:FAD-dependent oxidoreductase n=1 Tax=Nonomuraea sp. NPDC003804 TaxID=3154547 RepID=UPI00339F5005